MILNTIFCLIYLNLYLIVIINWAKLNQTKSNFFIFDISIFD